MPFVAPSCAGAPTSGADADMPRNAASAGHETWLSGRDTGHMPFDINGAVARMVDRLIWPMVHHVLTIRMPMGRKAAPLIQQHGTPLERIRKADLEAAGVKRVVGRTVGVTGGLPLLDDGRVLDVRNVVWATGFRHEDPWIRLPVAGPDGYPMHDRGVVMSEPGLSFVGLPFQYAFTSSLIGGVGRDAGYVVNQLMAHASSMDAPARP